MLRTDRVDGFLLDRGFQVLSTAYPEARRALDFSALDRVCNTTYDAACAARLARPANTQGNGRPEATDLQFASGPC